MDERERAKIAAAVKFHQREVQGAERAVAGAEEKVSKLEERVEGAQSDLENAKEELSDARERLEDAEASFRTEFTDELSAAALDSGESVAVGAELANGAGKGGR